ncbi:phosphatidylinositol mannoside acyltransferase, partial [Rhodococcus hoagii]|nr:phosphatidylinositol mannoside acyltransferase [Prescottella equi]
PEDVPDDLIRDSLRSYAGIGARLSACRDGSGRDSGRCRLECRGAGVSEQAMAAGKGAILALPHSGNWDMAGVWCTRRGVGCRRSPSG